VQQQTKGLPHLNQNNKHWDSLAFRPLSKASVEHAELDKVSDKVSDKGSPNLVWFDLGVLQLIELLPVLAGWNACQEVVGKVMVGDLLRVAIKGQLGVDPLGNDSQGHDLAQRPSNREGRAALFLSRASQQEVLVVIGGALWHGREF
jgi:hypothetical protein